MDKLTEKAKVELQKSLGLTEHQAGLVADVCLRVLRRERHPDTELLDWWIMNPAWWWDDNTGNVSRKGLRAAMHAERKAWGGRK